MAKTSTRRVYRKRTAKNTAAPSIKKPYGGRNNNDAYVRIEQSIPIVAYDQTTAFLRFRTRAEGLQMSPQNQDITQSPEFVYHRKLYGFYEVRGISAHTTFYPESYVARADMFAGPFPNIPAANATNPVVPTYTNLEGAAIHTQCTLNGEKSRIYYAYSKDLKNVGAQFAFPTSEDLSGPTNNTKAAIVLLAQRTTQSKRAELQSLTQVGTGFTATNGAVQAWNAGEVIGEIVITNYIRFHARVTNSAIALSLKEEALGKAVMAHAAKQKAANKENEEPMECAESQFSYAELQQQLHNMMQGNKAI